MAVTVAGVAPSLPEAFALTGARPRSSVAAWLRPWSRVYRLVAVALDLLLAAGVLGLLAPVPTGAPPVVAAVAAGVLVLLVAVHHGYDTRVAAHGPQEYRAVLRGGIAWVAVVLAWAVATGADPARPALLGALPLTVAALLAARAAERGVLRRRRLLGQLGRPALVVAAPEDLSELLEALGETPEHGLRPVGVCTAPGHAQVAGVPVLGVPAGAAAAAVDAGAEVVIASAALGAAELRRLSWALEGRGVELLVAPHLLEVGASRIGVRPVGTTALLSVSIDAPRARRVAKAAADRVAGALLLAAAVAVLLPAALAVRLTSPGPAFFRQTRIGAHGRPFTMYKLRSMTTDADRRLPELVEHSDGNGTLFKMREDPRVTPVGKVLRRYSIDELPQLFNVVRGDMSLVGPRPPLPAETETYDDTVRRRLRVRPGLTGLWQVSGRSDLSWEQSVRLDLRYVDNWSVPMDLAILGRTAGAVLGARGAY
jgi:exopolysaccharide biosynthesis polyprenyl glycosylphosphotransferase